MMKISSKFNQILSELSGWLMIVMMLLLVSDLLTRAIGFSINGLSELTVFVMIIVVYFGLARCEQYNEHVKLELITNRLPAKAKIVIYYFSQILSVITISLIFYAVLQNVLDSYQRNESLEGTLNLPIWPVKAMMVIGLVFFLFQSVSNMLSSINVDKKDKLKEMPVKNQELSN
ncbi:TRAP transporter small permease subunit [Photobacterium sp. DNB23_23_1]|uniref:TRAP transporter small permease protein n=1 Tax=Photobacterium pectinilyticum TaxID=2906793 RepID=A0ABT1N2F4_9GAMM|nr:TRAP transporter small permease [Photobacterium sp. ZSDE20]MCQ1058894.1 TRAP transporter small permease [Photobacterium sp. ZSDE20]MDD1823816.1 TRAP transporter small permease [Photobacterium sp. ZSDE20]